MTEYPQVTSEKNGEKHEITVRRSEFTKHLFYLYDGELGPVIEHLVDLQEEIEENPDGVE